MGLRLFTEDTSWEVCRRDLRFTCTSLAVRAHHEALAKALRTLLSKWGSIEMERRDAEDALVDATAVVGALDEELDEGVFKLVSRLLVELDHDSTHPTFKAYFPEPPSEVIRLGLESEIARTRELFAVAEARGASAEVRAVLSRVLAIHKRGEEALRAREKAFAAVSRVQLQVQDWKDSANAARRSIAGVLEGYAIKHHLARGYAQRFFSAASRSKKAGKSRDDGGL